MALLTQVWGEIGKIAGSAVGFWVLGTGAAIMFAKPIRTLLEKFKGPGVVAGCALALALLLPGPPVRAAVRSGNSHPSGRPLRPPPQCQFAPIVSQSRAEQ